MTVGSSTNVSQAVVKIIATRTMDSRPRLVLHLKILPATRGSRFLATAARAAAKKICFLLPRQLLLSPGGKISRRRLHRLGHAPDVSGLWQHQAQI